MKSVLFVTPPAGFSGILNWDLLSQGTIIANIETQSLLKLT